jgi:hypothetical protein
LYLTDENILGSIQCTDSAKLVSAKRLNKRSTEGTGWSPSECARLCFEGSWLPPYVYVDGLKIKVEPFVFPVTQCSRCWKLGHSAKRCSASEIICPKCGGKHENCNTSVFKCVNCSGKHMALQRVCPIFAKEKRLREIMAEYNCTYRKALQVYVAPEPTIQEQNVEIKLINEAGFPEFGLQTPLEDTQLTQSYAGAVIKAEVHEKKERVSPKHIARVSEQLPKEDRQEDRMEFITDNNVQSCRRVPGQESEKTTEKDKVHLSELLDKLKEILFVKKISLKEKVYEMIKCSIEWVILLCVGMSQTGRCSKVS